MRSSYVYEDLMAFDLNDSKNSRILTEKEIIGEDYHRLVDFLENEVLPKNIEYRKDNDNYITCITYSSLLKYNFSLEELKFIIKYLKSKNIEIRTILYNSYFIRDFKISTKSFSVIISFCNNTSKMSDINSFVG